jgi:predicted 2-oxoglutarate/Fe(II)-dependent dioxygenase YbiX
MLEYTEEISGVIALRLFDAEECGAVFECAKGQTHWYDATVAAQVDDGSFKTVRRPERAASFIAPPCGSVLEQSFDARMDGVIKPLVKQIWGAELTQHSATQVVRYVPGDYYRDHIDVIEEEPYRYFSIVCYLNEEFEGGRTTFPNLGHSVAPCRGKAIVFPSTYLHRAEPVTSGEKYVLVSWLTGKFPPR